MKQLSTFYLAFIGISFVLIHLIKCRLIVNESSSLEADEEDEAVKNMNRLKNAFLRNAMHVLKKDDNEYQRDEKNTASRNNFDQVPADELLLLNLDSDEIISPFDSHINVIQGDIIVPNYINQTRNNRKKRRIITNSQFGYSTRWPNRTIPYEFDFDANDQLRKKVYSAINLWHKNTCIQFEPYSIEKHRDYKSKVVIRNRGHCAARVGYVVDPFQSISVSDVFLPEHCPLGSVIHELGHVIGFRHEHTRTDRESHIKVHYERMQSSQRPQYELMENGIPGYLGIYYDLFSIMHYSSQGGLLEARDHRRSFLMGQRFTLSFSDVKMANQAYNCDEHCSLKSSMCQNEGFIDATCTCRCPDGISGQFCEHVNTKQPELRSMIQPRLTCDFEADICDWINEDTRDSEDWLRAKGLTKTQLSFNKESMPFKTGPQLNDKVKNDSIYIYLNSYDQTKAYANAILMSPQIVVNNTEIYCLRFFYHMYGAPHNKVDAPIIGTLAIKLRDANGQIRTIWRREGTQSENWQYDEMEVFLEPPHTILFFEAETEDWKYGDIAIDDTSFTIGPCKQQQQQQVMENIFTRPPLMNQMNMIIMNNQYETTTTIPPFLIQQQPPQQQQQSMDPFYQAVAAQKQNWGAWSDWSSCSKSCGGGLKIRNRYCLSNDLVCIGEPNETIDCNMEPCSTYEWSEWTEWTECSVSCGNGLQSRNRDCLIGHCEGFTKEIRPCIRDVCPELMPVMSSLSATWSNWSDWSVCNPQCPKSIEFRYRTRECKIPYNPKNQFQIKNECLGANKEFKPCTPHVDCRPMSFIAQPLLLFTTTTTTQPPPTTTTTTTTTTPIPSQWSEWSDWSNCSKPCYDNINEDQSGYQARTRLCQQYNSYAMTCLGDNEEKRPCYPNVPCQTSTTTTTTTTTIEPPTLWSEWSKCSATCGNGTKTRVRYCSRQNYDFPCEGRDVIMERIICTSYTECGPLNTAPPPPSLWSEWSAWSACSVPCGQGFALRRRICTGMGMCEGGGAAQELKPCLVVDCGGGGDGASAENNWMMSKNSNQPMWSDWSDWSECVGGYVKSNNNNNCGVGIRSRKRVCLLDNREIESKKCQGGAVYISSQCLIRNCTTTTTSTTPQTTTTTTTTTTTATTTTTNRNVNKYTDGASKLFNAWSFWSACSNLCGNGLMTRFRKCMPNEFDCNDVVLEQKTCESQLSCINQTVFMRCSFDQREYCPLENVNSKASNSQWQMTMPKMFPNGEIPFANPYTGGNYIFLNGIPSFVGQTSRVAIFRTPTISGHVAGGQCLAFYFSILNEKATFEVNKVNLDGRVNELFKRDANNQGNKWIPIYVGVKSRNDFYIEFKGTIDYNSNGIIALDDISLHPIDRCQLLSCTFDNDGCKANQVKDKITSNKIWFIERFQTSSMTFSNYYLRADLAQIKPGKKSIFGLPIVFPRYPRMCLSFIYLLNGTSFSELKAGLVQDNDFNFIWQESTNYNGVWKKALIDFYTAKKFQLIFEVYNKGFNFYSVKSSNHKVEIVALDNVKLTYGSCSSLENIEFEDEYLTKIMSTVTNNNNNNYNNNNNGNLLRNKTKRRRKRSSFYSVYNNPYSSAVNSNDCGAIYDLKYGQQLILQSPGFPLAYNLNQKCNYLIRTSENNKIQIKMIDLNIEDNDRHDSCNDYLEIRYFNIGQPGPKFCGNLEKYNGVFTLKSFRNDALLIFASDWAITQKGFKLEITIV